MPLIVSNCVSVRGHRLEYVHRCFFPTLFIRFEVCLQLHVELTCLTLQAIRVASVEEDKLDANQYGRDSEAPKLKI